tara:strand:+ start:992 stop:1372 length:381 start_codon:yes stop_codon:yes gene_type:complete
MITKDWLTMATRYVREFGFKETLTDSEALEELNFMIEKLLPAIEREEGIISAQLFSGAGGIRSQIRLFVDMKDAAGYERLLFNPEIREHLKRLYSSWDLKEATQNFLREITGAMVAAHSDDTVNLS